MSKNNITKNGIPMPVKVIAAGAALGASFYALAGNVFYNINLSRKGLEGDLRKKLSSLGKKEEIVESPIFYEGIDWFNSTPKVKASILSSRNEKLYADVFTSTEKTDVWVVCIHGYTSSPEKMGMYAKVFCEDMKYNVLMPSLNGHADSENPKITMGWDDRLDILDWIDYIVRQIPDSKIIIHGVSMGAATVMMTLGENLPSNVKCAIEDCGYTSVWDIFDYQIKNVTKIPKSMLIYSVDMVTRLRSKYDFKDASSVEQLKKSSTPTLFIHGEKDTFVPYYMLDAVFQAAKGDKEKVSIPDAIHARSCCVNPQLYWGSIKNFVKRYI